MPSAEIAQRTPIEQALAQVASDSFAAKLSNALPENVSVKRFQSVAATAIRQNPAVIIHPDSLFTSLVRCAQDGLIPDGREAALVVFRTKAGERVSYMPMIAGLRKRLAEHGFDLTAYAVYETDDFDYELGAQPWVKHKPPKLGANRGAALGAYAVAKDLRTKQVYVEVMARAEIEQVRGVSRAKDAGPWKDWYDEMARKTVARRLAKQLPLADTESLTGLLSSIDAEFDFGPANGTPISVDEANLKAISANLPAAEDEDTLVRSEPSAEDGPDEAQLNRLALLVEKLGHYPSDYLEGAFAVGRFEELTAAQAGQAEAGLVRMIESRAGEPVEGEIVDADPFAGIAEQPPPPPEPEPEPEPAAAQPSFEDMVPESVKKQSGRRRS